MNTFLGFLIASFMAGLYFWDKKPNKRVIIYIAASILLALAYYQINNVI